MSEYQPPLHETWRKVVDELVKLTQAPDSNLDSLSHQERAYLNLAKPVALVEGVAVLAVPHAKSKEFIETKLGEAIKSALGQRMGRSITLAVTVDASAANQLEPEPAPPAQPIQSPHVQQPNQPYSQAYQQPFQEVHTQHDQPAQHAVPAPQPQQPNIHPRTAAEFAHAETTVQQPHVDNNQGWQTTHHHADVEVGFKRNQSNPATRGQGNSDLVSTLNPSHTFDNYVVSDSNKLPASAAIAVAERPARAYNPLFIWGDSGLGKTHLMHAIGNYAHQLHPQMKIKYVSSEEFTNDYINSVRDDRQESFKRRYRDVDILMVDDIQFLQGKEGTQEEFFHTFNALEQGGKQIVLSSDRPPKQLTTLEDRLRTRFQAGLIADIYPPDLETRIAILSKKAKEEHVEISPEILAMIASRFDTSIRELEGAFISVIAHVSLNNLEPEPHVVEEALRKLGSNSTDVEFTPEAILNCTADHFQVKAKDLKGTSKTRNIAHARQIAMYLCRELTTLSYPKIGESFGGKDHTTVMYAERKIRKEMKEKHDTFDEIQQITNQLKTKGQSGS